MAKQQAEGQKPVDREAVKLLATAVGLTEAAKRLGLSEQRVRQWSSRGKWFKQPDPIAVPPTNGKHMQFAPVTTVTSPSQALQSTLAERSNKTKLHLSKYTLDASKQAARSKGELKHAKAVKEVAGTAALIHNWQGESKSGGDLSLNILSGQAVIQVNTKSEQG